ncbi:DUF5677 domain-containing protein [Nocardioides sp. GY 10127]|uniref:DUF5677 domain-containing protein n=1 Tax=Nocardioides sp. GY 10127 TaxID=2569762 RepID=UPI0010A8FDAB|nr:DUF5677 domain-containing protein [Nocardioides sp. GY 10127]TIC80702.1 hypothetical protein E8D37_12480 [Nocardioides sp. GY 10127]
MHQEDPNDHFGAYFEVAFQRLSEAGLLDNREAVEDAFMAVVHALRKEGVAYGSTVVAEEGPALADAASERLAFRHRLRAHWGQALDTLEILIEIVEDASRHFEKRARMSSDPSLVSEILGQFTANAIRLAREIHELLSAGYPLGALSLTRTMHEIAVRAGTISKIYEETGSEVVAERYLAHGECLAYVDALTFQKNAATLGYDPLSDEQMRELRESSDAHSLTYGKGFSQGPYAWAASLAGLPRQPKFVDLEKFAGLDHERGYYKWSSHLIHADARAIRLNQLERGGRFVVLTGQTNIMLADPAEFAASNLHRCYVSLTSSVMPMAAFDVFICSVVETLRKASAEAFVEAEERVLSAELELQAELAKMGLRFDPIDGEVPLD